MREIATSTFAGGGARGGEGAGGAKKYVADVDRENTDTSREPRPAAPAHMTCARA